MAMNTVPQLENSSTGKLEKLHSTNNSAHVTSRTGTGNQPYIYSVITDATPAREEIHFPAGASITELTIIVRPAAAAGLYTDLLLAIDAASDVDAANVLTGTTHPDDLSVNQRFYLIPSNGQPFTIPLSSALSSGDNSTGRLDFRGNAANALNIWILGN